MAAIGDVDEANSAIGVAICLGPRRAYAKALGRIQNDLFDLGADLATPGEDFAPLTLRIVAARSRGSSRDRRDERGARAADQLHPARRQAGAAALHLARAITAAPSAAVAAAADRPQSAGAFLSQPLVGLCSSPRGG
jgi:cob(I)alamin adenosyltransferase